MTTSTNALTTEINSDDNAILWDDAPIGTTHYDPNPFSSDWVMCRDTLWFFWDNNKYRWAEYTPNEPFFSRYIAK
jgi:hypothetical protein